MLNRPVTPPRSCPLRLRGRATPRTPSARRRRGRPWTGTATPTTGANTRGVERSARQERQPHRPHRVVAVGVDQADRLPGAQRQPAVSTGTDIDGATRAGSTWSRPWPGLPCRCRQRSSAGSRSRSAASRSVSLPAPVSMTASPAVACGTHTFSRPSRAPTDRRNRRSPRRGRRPPRGRRSGSPPPWCPRADRKRGLPSGTVRTAFGRAVRRPRRLPEHGEHRHPTGLRRRRGGRGGRRLAHAAPPGRPTSTPRWPPAGPRSPTLSGCRWTGWRSGRRCPRSSGCRGGRARRSAGAGRRRRVHERALAFAAQAARGVTRGRVRARDARRAGPEFDLVAVSVVQSADGRRVDLDALRAARASGTPWCSTSPSRWAGCRRGSTGPTPSCARGTSGCSARAGSAWLAVDPASNRRFRTRPAGTPGATWERSTGCPCGSRTRPAGSTRRPRGSPSRGRGGAAVARRPGPRRGARPLRRPRRRHPRGPGPPARRVGDRGRRPHRCRGGWPPRAWWGLRAGAYRLAFHLYNTMTTPPASSTPSPERESGCVSRSGTAGEHRDGGAGTDDRAPAGASGSRFPSVP